MGKQLIIVGADFSAVAIGTAKVLASIAITTPPSKTSYKIGEYFNTSGMVVTATYTDGSSSQITGYTYSPTQFSTIGTQTVTISYTRGGITKTTTTSVSVAEGSGGDTPTPTPEYKWFSDFSDSTKYGAATNEAKASFAGFNQIDSVLTYPAGTITLTKIRFNVYTPGIMTIGLCSLDRKTVDTVTQTVDFSSKVQNLNTAVEFTLTTPLVFNPSEKIPYFGKTTDTGTFGYNENSGPGGMWHHIG